MMSDTFNWRLPSPPGDLNAQPPAQSRQSSAPNQPWGQYPPPRPRGGVYPPSPPPEGEPWSQYPPPYSPPPESTEPYIPSRNDRPHDQWGTPDFALQGAMGYPGIAPGPYMPQSRDLAPLLHGIVMGVGRWGSHYSAMPAIAMGTYASAYWKAYQQGMHERANQNWQQYRQAQQMFLDRQAEELREAKDINARYADDPDKLHQAMYQLARKNGDQTIINAIESGNYAAVDRIWGERDKSWTDATKIKAQQDKQAQETEERRLRIEAMREQARIRQEKEKAEEEKRKALERARQRIDPGAVGPGPGYTPPDLSEPGSTPPPEPESGPPPEPEGEGRGVPPDASGDDTAPADVGAPPDTAPSAISAPPNEAESELGPDATSPQEPVRVADASGQVPIGGGAQRGAPPPAGGPEGKPETPVLENAAKNWVFTHKLPTSIDKKTMPDFAARAEARGAELENYLNNLAADPKVTSDQMKSEVRRLFPGFANTIEKAIAGDIPPPRSLGASNQAYWNMLYNIGAKIDPKFTADTFAERAKARIFWTSGPGGNKLTSVGTAFKHLQDLRELVKNGAKPTQLISPFTEWWATHFGEIGEFNATLNTAMHEYENALASSGASGGGSATIPALKDATKELTVNQSDSNFIANIDQKIKLLGQRLEELQRQYQTSTGRPSEEIMKRFEDYAKSAAPAYSGINPKFSDDLVNAPDRLHQLEQGGAAKEGDRKQFKQGWGVFHNGKWVPE